MNIDNDINYNNKNTSQDKIITELLKFLNKIKMIKIKQKR